jgi:MraZ protein
VFRGTFQHSIDAKGRTSLPARFRETLATEKQEQLVITQGPGKCLWCWPETAWSEFEKKVLAMPRFKPEVQALMHGIVAPAQDCPFDKMGRILVPQTLRKYAELESENEVVWAGALDRIELWSASRWQKRSDETAALLDGGAFAEMLGNLGL